MENNTGEVIPQKGKTVKNLKLPPTEFLKSYLTYDPETGEIRFRKNGKLAGSKKSRPNGSRSCIQVCITYGDGWKLYVAHRIAFALMDIEIAENMDVDHINRDPWDNRWCNLRVGTHQENSYNRPANRQKASKLPLGVFRTNPKDPSWNSAPFVANIRHNGKLIHLGSFNSVEEAVTARVHKERELAGEFAPDRSL